MNPTLQTAEQINRPQTGQVIISEIDPGQPAPERAAADLKASANVAISLKLPREKMIAAVKNARQVPRVYQEAILAEIEAIDPKHELLRLDFVRHAHRNGANAGFTVTEL